MIPKDPFLAVTLARAPDTDKALLVELTEFPLAFVREAAISNATTPLSAVTAALPHALSTEAEIGIARAIASRSDTPASLLEQLVDLLDRPKLDGSHRENWPHEQLAVMLLVHANLSGQVRQAFLSTVKVSKRLRSAVLSTAISPVHREPSFHGGGA